ncbi:hypothetical protein JTE90_015855 [Oedothorax gibbosus]|uniref:Uncharacterized protein n=1 Tax=Oedothorax gibbosus TaxID=931172 RepID=A0AAV6VVL7_9ARAC|nr:hypothetical protein JTE90_015855 [Oedothorax gibbosus]
MANPLTSQHAAGSLSCEAYHFVAVSLQYRQYHRPVSLIAVLRVRWISCSSHGTGITSEQLLRYLAVYCSAYFDHVRPTEHGATKAYSLVLLGDVLQGCKRCFAINTDLNNTFGINSIQF